MKDGARLQATMDILSEAAGSTAPLDNIVRAYLRTRRYIGSKDRGAINDLVYDIVRRESLLLWWAERLGAGEDNMVRAVTLLALVFLRGLTLEQIRKNFSGGTYEPARLTTDEETLLRAVMGKTLTHPDQPEDVTLNCPLWVFDRIKAQYPDTYVQELSALQDEAPFDLRVNTLKGTRDGVVKFLQAQGLSPEIFDDVPTAVRLRTRQPIDGWDIFKGGQIEVQDVGAQRVCEAIPLAAAARVMDFCAGAGGKALALAARLNNKGQIYLVDVDDGKLTRAKVRLKRAWVHNYMIRHIESESDGWMKRQKARFDTVLTDVPCTGVGTWRRNPDARWRYQEQDLINMTALQARILASAARLVKEGGQLVYVTCSLLEDENQAQVQAFLAAHPTFSLRDTLTLTPYQNGCDGFFMAVLDRALPA